MNESYFLWRFSDKGGGYKRDQYFFFRFQRRFGTRTYTLLHYIPQGLPYFIIYQYSCWSQTRCLYACTGHVSVVRCILATTGRINCGFAVFHVL